MGILKITGIILLSIFVLFLLLVLTRQNRKFEAPYPEIAASDDSAVIAKGKYLFYGPAHCMDCHAGPEDLAKVEEGIVVPARGGRTWHLPVGLLRAANITSDKETGIGAR